MPNADRVTRLQTFEESTPHDTRSVYTVSIPSTAEGELLMGYHPDANTGGYEVTTKIEGSTGEEYLKVVPESGQGWRQRQLELLDKLMYVPMPEQAIANRDVVLLLSKQVPLANRQLEGTGWFIVYSRIAEFGASNKTNNAESGTLSELILLWQHEKWPEYIATCWKW